MEDTLTGYQWGDDMSYIGMYTFPNNADQEKVHLPPRTTLTPPPLNIPDGYEAAFDQATNTWVIRLEDLTWAYSQIVPPPGMP